MPPPSLEERLLDVDKPPVPVLEQRRDQRVEHILDASNLDGIVGADVVLVDGLEPSDVVVGVGDDVDVELVVDDPLRGVVGDVGCSGGAPHRSSSIEEEEEE